MNTKSQEYFLELARCCNFTRAAKNLYISQTALSKTINGLEEELGTKLFTRSSHRIQLTEDGMLLRHKAQELIQLADKLEKEFQDLTKQTGYKGISI